MRALTIAALCFAADLMTAGVARAEPRGVSQPHIDISLGARVSKVTSSGYDPFASSDELPQVSLGLGATVFATGRFSLAGVAFWDYGGHSAEARGEPSSLTVQRVSLGPEFRYHLLSPLYLFAHALPAFAYADASLDDDVAGATRHARHWSYGVDGAAGAALELYARRSDAAIQPGLWVIAEGGYGYLSTTHLRLEPDSDAGAPQRSASTNLGSLSLAGPYARVSVAVSF